MTTQQIPADFGDAHRPIPTVGQRALAPAQGGRPVMARVIEVGTRIHTRSAGGSNYIWLTVDMDDVRECD